MKGDKERAEGGAPAAAEDARWLAQGRRALATVDLAPQARSFGTVVQVGDGIAHISGLPDVRLNELLHFEGGKTGLALALDEETISAIILDEADAIEAGTRVSGTGEVVQVPVGDGLLGRVVDPLGRQLDEGDPIRPDGWMPVERAAPAIIERALVSEPVETGVLVVDALFALGRGQRELIIGDRATGKTSLALDAIINQKHSDMVCVYVAVGQRASAIERAIEAVRTHGAFERCIFVIAPAASAPGLQWIAPFAGFTMAEHVRDKGGHALIVIDDLTKHAATHRELALLTREPPGREAYPGDIFYLHARLLERAARLAPELGGGSLTALPIAETDAGNLSAYIPTNLISITDGQIVMDSKLFAANRRPAVDVGLSVSRVGGKAQRPALRQVSGRVRLDYAQFQELEMFTRFGGITDTRFRPVLTRGERIRAVLVQSRFAAMPVEAEVALLAALGQGALDPVAPDAIPVLRERIAATLPTRMPGLAARIEGGEKLDDQTLSALAALVTELADG
ncbi:F0F1 ATP synthase subunit alpha [Novosphingobium sp. ZN18A2]|uniref:F0F1 ATP synthase subunit alpha n=1 Tax=Novosphingobium sp. ZN18A2 TaxID=3079861 RepID=UPI0030CB9944